jgi:wyosine [tRNA(Phe)-imidazoG37] synthetase (radical SAM superfamily)
LWQSAAERVRDVRKAGEPIDYVTFVPDGEPTLDLKLGREIGHLKLLGTNVAVISNASLLWRPDVRHDLRLADWVSLKVDAVDEETWRRVNRPHRSLRLASVLRGLERYAESNRGQFVTETMLVKGLNDHEDQLVAVAEFLAGLKPQAHYLAIPTRPPAESWVMPPDEQTLNRAYQIFSGRIPRVELLVAYEGTDFATTGRVEEDILAITAVHPMREDAVVELLDKAGADWSAIQGLVDREVLSEVRYRGLRFYVRRIGKSTDGPSGARLAS